MRRAADYMVSRQRAVKQMLQSLRQGANLTQADVARFLGTTARRISAIENLSDSSDYTLAELELLATLYGKHPRELFPLSDKDGLELGRVMTETLTAPALKQTVDCELSEWIIRLSQGITPGSIKISPMGDVVAAIIDKSIPMERDLSEGENYFFTIVAWDPITGEMLGQVRLPHVTDIAPLDKHSIVIVIAQPQLETQDRGEDTSGSHLLIWNIAKQAPDHTLVLPDCVDEIAISPDKSYLAVYMAKTTSMQVWTTRDWKPCRAFLFDDVGSLIGAPLAYRTAVEVEHLLKDNQYPPSNEGRGYHADSLYFMTPTILVLRFSGGQVELEVANWYGVPYMGYDEYGKPRNPLTTFRNQKHEIAVTDISWDHYSGESTVELSYRVPRGKLDVQDTYVTIRRHIHGVVFGPALIIDETCVLVLVLYQTPYMVGLVHKCLEGVWNVVSGRVVILNDQERLSDEGDEQIANVFPQGDAVVYWALPADGVPRLTVQVIDRVPLCSEISSLVKELEQKRKLRTEEDVSD